MERRHVYGAGIALAGAVLTIIQLVQGIQQVGDLTGYSTTTLGLIFAFETLPFVLIGLTLVYAGYWLTSEPEYEPDLPQVLAWGAGSTLLFASVGALILFSQQVTLGTLEQGQYVVINHVTVGAVVGILVGIYDARGRARQRDLERERDRIETFAGKAADINNYGRELNRATSIEEVSALCIQGLQTLLGLTDSAFVAHDPGESTVVNSTIINADDETLIEIAGESRDQDRATAEIDHSSPDGLAGHNSVLSMLVAEHENTAVVLLAVSDSDDGFEDEDIQLLELLVSHAGTALDRIHREVTAETTSS